MSLEKLGGKEMRRHYSENHEEDEMKAAVHGEVVNANRVNVRKKPNINSEVLGVVNHGEKFPIVGDDNRGFYSIDFDGKPGFIHSDYFKPIQEE